MNSRDRVLTAFTHQEPDRVPRWCGSSPEFWSKAKAALQLDDEGLRKRFGDDFRRVWARYVGPELPLPPGIVSRTMFGIERRGVGFGQPTSHPLSRMSWPCSTRWKSLGRTKSFDHEWQEWHEWGSRFVLFV